MKPPRRPTGSRETRSARSNDDAATRRQERAKARIAKRYRRLEVENRPRGPQFLAVLLCLLGAAIVAYGLFGPSTPAPDAPLLAADDLPSSQAAAGPQGSVLDPEPLRERVSAFETALFRTGDSLERIGRRVAGEAVLLERAAEAIPGPRAEALARGIAQIGDDAAGDLDFNTLERLRRRWLALRGDTLRPAGWMAKARAADDDRAPIAAYRDAAAELDSSIRSAIERASTLTVPDPMRGPDERDERVAEWAEFAASWRDQLLALERSLPGRPAASATSELLGAVQQFDSALGRARSLAADDRLVVRADPLASLERAALQADEANRALADLALD